MSGFGRAPTFPAECLLAKFEQQFTQGLLSCPAPRQAGGVALPFLDRPHAAEPAGGVDQAAAASTAAKRAERFRIFFQAGATSGFVIRAGAVGEGPDHDSANSDHFGDFSLRQSSNQ